MKTTLPRKRLADLESLLDAAEPNFAGLSAIECELVDTFDATDGLSKLTPGRRGFYVAWWLSGEVNNGGFNQFLFNKGPVYAGEAISFCQARGIVELVDLLERAIAALPGGALPATHEELQEILAPDDDEESAPIDAAHEELDSEFFAKDLEGSLMFERLRWVREHADEFFK